MLNHLIANTLPLVPRPIVYRFARKYVAGAELADAVGVVRELAAEGAMATIDVLGEDITEASQADQAVEDYLAVLDAIVAEKLDANISVKPTMFGLKIDRDLCLANLRRLVEAARERDIFVRLDMEDSTCTDDTFWLTRELKQVSPAVGVVIQAYLRRTLDDVLQLAAAGTNVRVCKGIYIEPRRLAWQDRLIVIRNFGLAVDRLLEGGCYVGVATHDEHCVWDALRTVNRLGLARDRYEFQMLLGVEPALRRLLLDAGHRMRVYVPFGRSWFAYSVRRLKENPAIVGHVLKSLLARSS